MRIIVAVSIDDDELVPILAARLIRRRLADFSWSGKALVVYAEENTGKKLPRTALLKGRIVRIEAARERRRALKGSDALLSLRRLLQ